MEETLPVEILKRIPAYDIKKVHGLFETAYSGCLQPKIIVLDDDPTGIQTVHDVSVYTGWDKESVLEGFSEPGSLFFILTNSRSFSAARTEAVHREIAENVCYAAEKTGKAFLVCSRGDSTLRGHFPLETETVRKTVERKTGTVIDGEILIPFFLEGGRFTMNDIHYVRQGNELCPAGQTEFARDKSFPYTSSNLKSWCEEKSCHRIAAGSVIGIELEDLRTCNTEKIERQLCSVRDFGKVIVNAVDYTDLEVFCIAFFHAWAAGKRFIFRCAASIVKVLGNIGDKPLLVRNELIDSRNRLGGIILIGSHVKKTTEQLEQLRSLPSLEFIEFDQHRVLIPNGLEQEVERTVARAEKGIKAGRSVVVYTRRERLDIPDGDAEKNLAVSVTISDAVTSVISKLTCRPGFIIAKGGITSSDVGTKALMVKKARVMGQLQPGVPVWMTGPESKFPSMPYVIFPGNVGDSDTLKRAVQVLMSGEEP